MSTTEKNIRSIFCPYYINIDRLIDISASISDGYSDYEDIETSKVASKNKSKSFSGKHSNKIFSLGFGRDSTSGTESTETKKVKRIHTQASLLNNTVKALESTDRLHNLSNLLRNDTWKSQPLFECSDIVTFAGKVEQDKYGIAELTTYGAEAKKVNMVKNATLITPLIMLIGGILLGTIKYVYIYDIIRLIVCSTFLMECVLYIYLLFISNASTNMTKQYKAIKKSEKRSANLHKVQISFDMFAFWDMDDETFIENLDKFDKPISIVQLGSQFKFLCYLYDDYFYQSEMKDILGRALDCLAIIKSIEKSLVEIEVIALYI